MHKIFLSAAFAIILTCCSSPKNKNPHVEIQTSYGDIEVELYPAQAPKTVAAFLSYIDSGYYNKASFYRVLTDDNQASNAPKSELIQGGIWKTNYKLAAALPGITHESTQQTKILHKDGTISLARQAPGTANKSSEVKTMFFVLVPASHIHQPKTIIRLQLISDKKVIQTINTNFVGPVND